MTGHDYYNRANFPLLIVNHGKWDIMANESGHCAAIPTPEAEADGCKATQYGTLDYVRVTLGVDVGVVDVPAIGSQWQSTCTGAVVTVAGFDGVLPNGIDWTPAPSVIVTGGMGDAAEPFTLGPLPWFRRIYRPVKP